MYKKPYRLLFSYFNVSAMWMNKAKYANYLNILEGNYLSKTVFFLTNKHFYSKKKKIGFGMLLMFQMVRYEVLSKWCVSKV